MAQKSKNNNKMNMNMPRPSMLWIYGLIFVLYFLICWPISLLSRHMEKTWQN